mmetsp:Transcript_33438/g.37364  ORF Transcript_33438/g.37364 Transcript_33438/m.37364 type:complete len:89 (+) Transcript_33438:1028-1294(+)
MVSFFLTPSPQVVKKMSNNELLVAATVAGSIMEMGRTLLLYPLQTIKTRVQADKNHLLHYRNKSQLLVSTSKTRLTRGIFMLEFLQLC